MRSKPFLRATVDRIVAREDGRTLAVLVFDDSQQLVVDTELLPRGTAEKQVVKLTLEADIQETARRAGEIERIQRQLFGE